MMSVLNSVVSRKISASGLNVMSVPVPLALPITSSFFSGLAPLKLHVMHLAIARDLDLEPFAHGVDALGADTVGAARKLVAALAVFAAGMQRGQHQLDARQAAVLVDVHGDATAVVADGDGAIHVDGDLDFVTITGEVFVHGIVQHLGDAVMQGALVRAANVHARLLAYRFQSLELA